ncbi:hypothetical protein DITRI_Ditri16bG0053800 [Diplodiscus trichospermus]
MGEVFDFSTQFSFQINIQNASKWLWLCFFLAPVGFQIPPNFAGGFLRLFNSTTSDSHSNQIVSIVFDSFENPKWDLHGNSDHVRINNNFIASTVYNHWNASFHSEDTAIVFITYNSTTKNLTASWSYVAKNNPLENSNLSFQIDLTKVLTKKVMVGFFATTCAYVEGHVLIKSWDSIQVWKK